MRGFSRKQKAETIEGYIAAEEKTRKIYGAPEYPRCPICNGRQQKLLFRNVCVWCGSKIEIKRRRQNEGH